MVRILRQYQSEIYGNYRKAYLLYGLYAGLIMSAFVLLSMICQRPLNAPESYGTDIVLFLSMVLFSYLYRRKLDEERVFFKELMLLNLGIGILGSIVYGLFLLLYGNVIDTDFFNRCLILYTANMNAAEQATAEQIADAVAAYQNYKPLHWAFIGAFRSAVMGIICAFIAALILRTEQNQVKPSEKKN
ncbi:MAG: DUF4199 domain-containing protein [Bacteroidales bacterium]|nr:DUF4199 domain-containing protein [Bacteroidales bacterium]